LPANRLKVVVGVAVDFDSVVRDDTKIARAASEDCIEQFRIRAGIDGLDLGIVVNEPDLADMIAKEPKAATKLSVAIGN
jgi:hypothetical protein